MSYNAKNHTEQGGEKTVIGGKVVIENGAEIEIKEGAEVTGLPAGGTKLYLHQIGYVGSYWNFLSTRSTKFTTSDLIKISPSRMPLLIFLPSSYNSNGVDLSFVPDGAGPGYTYQTLARKQLNAESWTKITENDLNSYTVTEF